MNELDEEKKFYERFWALLNNRNLMTVFEKYGPTAFRRSSVLEGFEAFIDSNNFRGKHCVEIGTLKGLTACMLSRNFESVTSIDIIDDPLKLEIIKLLGITNINFINVANNFEKADIIGKLKFDAAYVDGDHTNDTDSDFNLVKKCGKVLFHEHWPAQPAVISQVAKLNGKIIISDKWALWIA